MAGKRPYDPMAQREATSSLMLDGIDVLMIVIGLYAALAVMFRLRHHPARSSVARRSVRRSSVKSDGA